MNNARTIHALLSRTGMDDDTYRSMLWDRFRVNSSKDLTEAQAAELVATLHQLLPEADRAKHPHPRALAGAKRRYEHLAGRDQEYATPAQLRMLEAAFVQRSRAQSLAAKQLAFREWLSHHYGLGVSWIQRDQVGPMLKAIGHIDPDSVPRQSRARKPSSNALQTTLQGA